MTQPPNKSDRWSKTLRQATPPVLTVLASAAILSGAVWIHNRQAPVTTTVSSTLGSGTSFSPSSTNDTLPNGNGSSAHPTGNSTSTPQSQPNQPSSTQKPNSSTPPPTQPPVTSTGDIGFGPVSGGTVKSLSDSPLSGGSQASCVVTQYGSFPQTSFGDRGLATPNGNDLPLPSGISNHSLLALSLQSGVLWAVVPPASMDAAGRPATSNSPTTLYYTPFPTDASSTLATGAIALGQLPISVPGGTSPSSTFWYHPVMSHLTSQGQASNPPSTGPTETTQSTTSNSDQTQLSSKDTSTSSGNASSNTSSAPTPPAGAEPLFLQGFYQTSVGAVIAVSVNDSATGANDTWLYLWNAQVKTLNPITRLQSSHDTFSWFAVGQDVIYWENRHVLPPKYVNFQGEQSVMNVHTLAITPIHLGTWSSQAAAFGNTLQFQVGRSVEWQVFNPAPSIAPSN